MPPLLQDGGLSLPLLALRAGADQRVKGNHIRLQAAVPHLLQEGERSLLLHHLIWHPLRHRGCSLNLKEVDQSGDECWQLLEPQRLRMVVMVAAAAAAAVGADSLTTTQAHNTYGFRSGSAPGALLGQ